MPRVNTNPIPNKNYLSKVASNLPPGSTNSTSDAVLGAISLDPNTFTVGDVVLLEAVVTKSGSSGGYFWNVVWGTSTSQDIFNDVPIFESPSYAATATYSNCYKYMVIAGTAGSVLGTAVYDQQRQIDTNTQQDTTDLWTRITNVDNLSIDWNYAFFLSSGTYNNGGYFKVIGSVQNSSDRIRLEWMRVSGYASGSFNVPTPEVLNSFYSLRQLSGYSGPAIRVRRSSGGEQDIGFSSGVLDITSLLSFVGSGDGFVTKWYEQTGFGNDLSNSTVLAQPQIVFSGSVNTSGGFPCIYFDGADDRLIENDAVSPFYDFSTGGRFSVFSVFEPKNLSFTTNQIFIHADRVTPRFSQIARTSAGTLNTTAFNTAGTSFQDNATTVVDNRRYLSSTIRRQNNVEIYLDGISNGSTATTGTPVSKSIQLEVGCRLFPSEAFTGNLYEFSIYDRDCATFSRQTIENQISNYYGI